MILGTLQCRVYGKVITKWANEMRLTKDSSGKPKWYDFGKQYDNVTIEATITAENGTQIEALVREQNLDESIEVVWEDGEWLYGYTGGFTIQTFESIGRVDKDLSEWGYKITFGSIEPIDFALLTGDRTQCSGAGYITYSNTMIPQPQEYGFQYHTEKYTGMTHGSSFSAEMPTIEHDSTSFKATVLSGNMRSLLDDITAHRGLQFFVTFPDSCYPFGISQGNGQFTCVPSKRDYTVTNENGDWYSIDIGLYNYIPVVPSTVNFFEAGTTEYPYVEAEWIKTGAGAVTWNALSVNMDDSSGGFTELLSVATGKPTMLYSEVEYHSGSFVVCGGAKSDTANRVGVFHNIGTGKLEFDVNRTSGNEKTELGSGLFSGFDMYKCWYTFSGINVSVVVEVYNGGVLQGTYNGNSNNYDNTLDYMIRYVSFDADVTYRESRIEGDGYPYTE